MESGMVVVTSPVSLGEPSSVLSLLSGFSRSHMEETVLYRVILRKLVSVAVIKISKHSQPSLQLSKSRGTSEVKDYK